jgi:hypothetical protein
MWGETDVSEPRLHCPIIHPRVNVSVGAVVVMMPAGDNSWLLYKSSLAVLPAEISGARRRNENFAYSLSLIRQRSSGKHTNCYTTEATITLPYFDLMKTIRSFISKLKQWAMAQVVIHQPLTAKDRVRPCGICGKQSGNGTGFFSEFFGFPLPI